MNSFKRIIAHLSIIGRSTLQGTPIVAGDVATPCCMYASRFSINTPSQLVLTTLTTHFCELGIGYGFIGFDFPRCVVLIPSSRFEVEYCVCNHRKTKSRK